MLKILDHVTEYMDFIYEVNSDPVFRDPMLSTDEQIQCNTSELTGNDEVIL